MNCIYETLSTPNFTVFVQFLGSFLLSLEKLLRIEQAFSIKQMTFLTYTVIGHNFWATAYHKSKTL